MVTKTWAIILILFTTLITSTAQISLKFGAEKLRLNILGIITNVPLIAGLLLYGFGGILLILSLKGGEVSVLYPILAMSYIWVIFLSIYFLNEQMNSFKWVGIFTIVIGVGLISLSSNRRIAETVGVG